MGGVVLLQNFSQEPMKHFPESRLLIIDSGISVLRSHAVSQCSLVLKTLELNAYLY